MTPIYQSIKLFFVVIFMFFLNSSLWATHNRAGEILIEQIGDCNSLEIKATIITYTKASSLAADRDTLTICWGDGTCEKVARSNGNGTLQPNDIKLNFYIAHHTYAGRGRYKISMTDQNRTDAIVNINSGSSVQIPFHVETIYTFLNPQFQGCNSTPLLLQPPIDIACVGQIFQHNPNAYDPDGDSLSYKLIQPLQGVGSVVPNYQYPNQVNAGPGNLISLNPVTGDFLWESPQFKGDYNIAILIISHRNGMPIDSTIRDMQITVSECDNLPPEIERLNNLCVIAGDEISFDVVATAPLVDVDQKVELNAFGGPLYIRDSAIFDIPPGYQPQPSTGTFRWQTTCNHIQEQYYSVVFRAADDFPVRINSNGIPDTSTLSTIRTVRIKVVGPQPLDLQTETNPENVKLSWELPYICEDAREEYFYGFSVWRKEGSNPFTVNICKPGLDGKGYTEVKFRTNEEENGRYIYIDEGVERGKTYCYRVMARFAKRTVSGQPYNLVDGLASDEVCVQLSRDLPLITHVDVKETDIANGRIEVKWSKPDAADLDTLLNPGPYQYQVLRSTGIGTDNYAAIPGANFNSNSFAGLNDSTFLDETGLNTTQNPYSYKIDFYVNGELEPLGATEEASSVFLNIASTDNQNNLSWDFDVPWENNKYVIYRDDNADAVFDSIGESIEPFFEDMGLLNGKEYCYYVVSVGSYGVSGIINPIVNHSQENCGIPLYTIPPCPPILKMSNFYNEDYEPTTENAFENYLVWTNPINQCEETDDVVYYNVYYAPSSSEPLELLLRIDDPSDTTYLHELNFEIAGCYAVTAVDTFENESKIRELVCVDNCPEYELPNAFTPNGDTQNDIFKPYPYRFIDHIEMEIYNRWGGLVFKTEDPDINWNGENLNGKELSDGVYFYKCKVFESRVDGVVQSDAILSGFIELVRNQK